MKPFSLLIKPSGSDCNLDCRYCFYKSRAPEVGQGAQRMSDEVLERLIKDYLELGFEVSGFAWQGGEPTLMGLDFYKRVVGLQKKYGRAGQQINNALQTNAVLLDDKWCEFLNENKFLVGISIDGPKAFHDYYRVDHSGGGSFDKVMKALERCKRHKVEFNVLVLLNDRNVEMPDELFDFFIERSVKYLQFIPCVEREAGMDKPRPLEGRDKIADFSITAEQYGEFLCRLFDRWYEYGPARLSIRTFDSILSYCLHGRGTVCTFDKQCDQYIVVEHKGDCFVCDFFVEPRWRLGNLLEVPIGELANSEKKRAFSRSKRQLCDECLVCRCLAMCRGGCVKDRFGAESGQAAASYFCASYKRFFDYSLSKFMQIAAEMRN